MIMRVAQQGECNSRVGTGAKESGWLDQVRDLLVTDYGFRRSQVERLDWNKWGVYCANGLSPEEACLAEFYSE